MWAVSAVSHRDVYRNYRDVRLTVGSYGIVILFAAFYIFTEQQQ